MGDWEKARYRNVKRNYEVLLALGNRTSWGCEPGSPDTPVLLWISLSLSGAHLPEAPFCVQSDLVGLLFFCVRARLGTDGVCSQCLVPDPPGLSSLPSELLGLLVLCSSFREDLLRGKTSEDRDFASFQVSEPLDQLSCVTAGRP